MINRHLNKIRSKELDESSQQMLFREIESREMTNEECYQHAHRQEDGFQNPRKCSLLAEKRTAVSLTLALKLTVS